MAPEIKIDDEVYSLLAEEAHPFVETTPNSVLRRLLGLDAAHANGSSKAAHKGSDTRDLSRSRTRNGSRSRRRRSGERAPAGSLLPEAEYEIPILRVLADNGGRMPTREVVERVGDFVADKLTPLDKAQLASGNVRWQNRVQFTRLRMVERALLKKDSPRGTWEISEEGRRVLNSSSGT